MNVTLLDLTETQVGPRREELRAASLLTSFKCPMGHLQKSPDCDEDGDAEEEEEDGDSSVVEVEPPPKRRCNQRRPQGTAPPARPLGDALAMEC